jgi:transposase, IS5 family
MYRKIQESSIAPENFELPFEGKLSADNRWVIMANLIPWEEFEEEYAQNFSEEIGAPAKTFRMALGALIIKEKLGTTDRETVEQIKENPYLQYFLGMSAYSNEELFDATMLVHFRKRISKNLINKINKKMVKKEREKKENEENNQTKEEKEGETKNRGKLILDATCTPADISYPQDLGILNQARKKTENILDCLYQNLRVKLKKKPRTYRKRARKDYLKVAKKRRCSQKERREAIKKQLQYIKRNLSQIEKLIEGGAELSSLRKRNYKMLLVVTEVYRQQLWMWENKSSRIDDRIVSINQPHIRPIVRGKAGKPVEFGAKLSVSCFDRYVFLDHLSWDNFNESGDLQTQVEEYKEFTGYYPESVHVDKIYRTRKNLAWCKERGIRMSGVPLGRPPKNISKETKKQALEDERIRNAIEGKFGQAKRRYSLDCIMTKLSETSETSIAITFLVINLSNLLRQVNCLFLSLFLYTSKFGFIHPSLITKDYNTANFSTEKLILKTG